MRVLIDTDPGLGSRYADVDDGLTLFLMFNNPQFFEIEGITTVFGNTPLKKGYKLLEKYLNLANKTDIPHYIGASSKDEFGKLNAASQFLIEKVKENPNELTLLTLGPLTNIATALKNYPDFLNNLKKFVMMGGILEPINPFSKIKSSFNKQFFGKSEFNFKGDAIATKSIIEANTFTPRIEIGLDICSKAVFKDEHLKKIESVNKPIPKFIAENIKFWLNLWKFSDKGGFFPFDTFVPIYLLKPELFKTEMYFLSVDTIEYPGMITILEEKRDNSAPITYCTDFKDSDGEQKFMEILIEGLIK